MGLPYPHPHPDLLGGAWVQGQTHDPWANENVLIRVGGFSSAAAAAETQFVGAAGAKNVEGACVSRLLVHGAWSATGDGRQRVGKMKNKKQKKSHRHFN